MLNLAKFSSVLPVLVILDSQGLVCYKGEGLENILAEQQIELGCPLPASLASYKDGRPWTSAGDARSDR